MIIDGFEFELKNNILYFNNKWLIQWKNEPDEQEIVQSIENLADTSIQMILEDYFQSYEIYQVEYVNQELLVRAATDEIGIYDIRSISAEELNMSKELLQLIIVFSIWGK